MKILPVRGRAKQSTRDLSVPSVASSWQKARVNLRVLRVSNMMNVHFSSQTDLHATPQAFFDTLNAEFRFDVDVCALPGNAKCEKFFSPEDDGLSKHWEGVCWMNPPYGREIGKWMKKAYESSLDGAVVVCLVPSRTDTKWWHDYAMRGDIRFIKGRLKFGDARNSAPFPSAVVVFRGVSNVLL